ncbi:Unknown protein [Striga hermonthica]|uniref:CCHC-type domain-containing protein n=1 Tax=Striga hermonthica TaxID=68872 RepID=A0A9N7NTL9_STRHE|nr:Unknown protein [Striga hermonthica]
METDLIEKLQKFDLSTKEDNGVTLSDDDISPGIQECSRSLIGKIHGTKRANFNGLRETLCNIWRTQQPFSIRLVGYNLFQFVFQSEADKHKVDLWVQIHGLPLHWITEDTGLKIGKLFANVKDVFVPDFGSITGRWIKILVQIDLNEHLLRGTKIKLGRELIWVDFRYENLQSFCYYCGLIGHSERECTRKKEDIKENKRNPGQFGDWLKASTALSTLNRTRYLPDRVSQKSSSSDKPSEAAESNKTPTPPLHNPAVRQSIPHQSQTPNTEPNQNNNCPAAAIQPMIVDPHPTITHSPPNDSLEGISCSITDDMNSKLVRPVTVEELKQALWEMHPLKAPGIDGALQHIGDGNTTSIWSDPWLLGIQNRSPSPSFISDRNKLHKVRDLLCADGSTWDKELIEQSFSLEEANLILKTPLSRTGQKDLLHWQPHKHGLFTVKSAYSLSIETTQTPSSAPESSKSNLLESKVWKNTWSLKIKNKIKTFLWRCWFNYIGTQDQLILKGIPLDPICKICRATEESLEHIFFSCSRAVNTWKLAGVDWTSFQHSSLTFRSWWTEVCTMKKATTSNDRTHFSTYILWRLWKCRNLWVFNNIWKSEMEIATQARREWVEFEELGLQSV